MEKKILVIAIVLAMSVFTGQIRMLDEYVGQNHELETHVNVVNEGSEDFDGVHLRAYVLETGEMFTKTSFDVDDGEKKGNFLFWDTDSTEPGEYLVRFTVSNDDHKEVKYRYINVY